MRSICLVLFLAIANGAAHGAESVYTALAESDCTTMKVYEESGGSEQRCEGVGGINVFVSDGDARISISFGDKGPFRTFGPFNSIGDKAEWRVSDNGEPYAAIVRYIVQEDGAVGTKAELLLISKIDAENKKSCPIAIVNATDNEQANGMARGAADMAAHMQCPQKPHVLGTDSTGMASTFDGYGG